MCFFLSMFDTTNKVVTYNGLGGKKITGLGIQPLEQYFVISKKVETFQKKQEKYTGPTL